MKREIISTEKNIYGAWIVTVLENGYFTRLQYYYYTKKQAISLAKKEVIKYS